MISGYRSMWIFVFFDLPTNTKKERKDASGFRKHLLDDGFQMMQYSVYYRHCASRENLEVHKKRVSNKTPPLGEVRIISITDKQFERMGIFIGKKEKAPEKAPAQLEFL